MKVVPLKDKILVKAKEIESKTSGGIYIPDTAKDEKVLEGKRVHGSGDTGTGKCDRRS